MSCGIISIQVLAFLAIIQYIKITMSPPFFPPQCLHSLTAVQVQPDHGTLTFWFGKQEIFTLLAIESSSIPKGNMVFSEIDSTLKYLHCGMFKGLGHRRNTA